MEFFEELMLTKKELARCVDYLENFREGVYQMLRDLDSHERELEDAYDKLKDTQSQLIQSSKMNALGELAASLAHELNQPLTVIKGLSQSLLKAHEDGSPNHGKVKLIVDASKRMELIIKHLKVFSRTEGPSFRPVDLNKVIKDAIVIVKELLADHSIELKTDFNPLPPVLGSAIRLEQVVINLITNAKDAMPDGGTLSIETQTIEAGGVAFASMVFRDTGSGIPKEIVGRIFDPFFTTKEAGKGTGLGLSISYGIIKEHSGDIMVESEPGRGTAFHITLPPAEG